MFGRRQGIAAAIAVALALSGCAAEGAAWPRSTASASQTAAPLFASEEAAAEAATSAYVEYVKMADQIEGDGGENPERIEEFADGDVLNDDLAGFQEFREAGARTVGSTRVLGVRFQSMEAATNQTVVRLYLCEDLSSLDVVDGEGRSLVAADRPDLVMYQVGVTFRSRSERKVTGREVWEGALECG